MACLYNHNLLKVTLQLGNQNKTSPTRAVLEPVACLPVGKKGELLMLNLITTTPRQARGPIFILLCQ